jgi:Flp pilus assembly CpaE family ATPase
VFQQDRPDSALMERLLAKCADRLSLLAAPATYDFGADAFDAIFDTLRMTTPCIVLDVPHQWSAWTKRPLVGADDILIVAEPDLANCAMQSKLNVLKARGPTTGRLLFISTRSACTSAGNHPREFARRSKPAHHQHTVRFEGCSVPPPIMADDRKSPPVTAPRRCFHKWRNG